MEMVSRNDLEYARGGGLYGRMTARELAGMATGAGLVAAGALTTVGVILTDDAEAKRAVVALGTAVASVGVLFLIFCRPRRYARMWATVGCALLAAVMALVPLAESAWDQMRYWLLPLFWFGDFWEWHSWEEPLTMAGGLAAFLTRLGLLVAALFFLQNFARLAGRRALQYLAPIYAAIAGLGQLFLAAGAMVIILGWMGAAMEVTFGMNQAIEAFWEGVLMAVGAVHFLMWTYVMIVALMERKNVATRERAALMDENAQWWEKRRRGRT